MLDGVRIAAEIKAEVGHEVEVLRGQGITPGLAVVLVGEVPASAIYVRSKVKTCGELGIYSEMLTPPETVTTDEMLAIIAELNGREEIDGILVQLPLPKHVDTKRLLEAVSPEKDVDGFHPVNAGRLQTGQPALAPCTPAGIMEIVRRSGIPVAGKEAVVVGRSDIVGKPAAMMLLNASATVTVCHSRTADVAEHTRRAEILVAAIGRAGFITPEMVRPGATLIDVGINRLTDAAEVERFFRGRCEPDGGLHEARFGRGGGYRSGGVRACGGIHAGAGRRGRADDCDADAEHGDGCAAAAGHAGEVQHACRFPGLAATLTMLRVGLTGGLGSGKSTVAAMLARQGAHVLSSDEIGRELMQPGHAVYDAIVAQFGAEVVRGDGLLDRKLAWLSLASREADWKS